MRLYYRCTDCDRQTYCDGLAELPDPALCWTCHAVAVLSYVVPNPIMVKADQIGATVRLAEAAAASRDRTEHHVVFLVC